MLLRDGGLDIFYIDESEDSNVYVVTAVAVPFLRKIDGQWNIVWPNYLEAAKQWRKDIKLAHKVPTTKELHAVKFASGRGRYFHNKWQFPRPKAAAVYRDILNRINFLPDSSIMSAATIRGPQLYGSARLEAALHALFQRMRSQCVSRKVNAIVFFDEGHPEYRKLYRRSQIYLPTGSMFGGWGSTFSRNLPLDMFTKDANEKQSKHCYFTQLADLIAYAAFQKIKHERGLLMEWQIRCAQQTLYDAIPAAVVNSRVTNKAPRDGIVRIF